MSKRRRTSSVASRQDEDTDDAFSETSPLAAFIGRKKKKWDATELCQVLYDAIRNHKKEDGNMLCDTFIRAPKRRQEPSYYEVVANPIDLLRVQQKLKTDSYEDIEELTSDLELLVNNAKAFYKPDSMEHQDACLLWDIFLLNKQKLLEAMQDDTGEAKKGAARVPRKPRNLSTNDPDDASEGSKDEDFDAYEELFASVVTATDPLDNRPLYTEFQLLPSKKLYPDYYDVIEHPIDLKFIATKIQTSAYTNLNEMEKDLLQMTKNACTFNEPGSQIYKDAKTLKKIFMSRKAEIESGKYKPIKQKKRGHCLSAVTAALKEEPESSDDELDDNVDTEGDGPMWQLFDQLYNTANASDHPNASGAPLGESLWKLPNRRFHQDYYNTVKKPISMAQVRNKLKKGAYSNITDMTADLYLMLDNAKKAYPATHKVHKDAVKMQKILNQKLIDTGVGADESDTEDGDVSMPSTSSVSPSAVPMPKKKGRPRNNPTVTSPPAAVNVPANVTQTPQGGSQIIMTKGRFPNNPVLKKKLLGLQKFLTDYIVAGRRPMALFMEKPSKKLYPDYYEVIQHPIDMNTIEMNIKADRYGTLDDVVGDYRLMFSNCRKYNEEGSQIFEDANILERALNEKLKEFSGIPDRRLTPKIIKSGGRKVITPLDNKLKLFYDTIREFRESKANRLLSAVFMKLPSKSDYPDYYDIIKNPIDMEKIANKMKHQIYDNVDEMGSDFMLMFENACKYNEPDSQIYKDALVLQQICLQTKQSLNRDGSEESVPDVPQAVQELLMSLFTFFYNHQDEEGRCFSDSLAELPEYDDVDGNKVRAISLDLIKRRLDKGLYRRLDMFQEDVFSCLDRARRLSRTDSQVFEDSIELQSFFIKKRDEICKNGEVLSSPALSYSAMHLSAAVEAVRQSKLLQEEQEHENETETASINGESMMIDQKVYSPGDFVYYDSPDNKIPGVVYIERLWTNSENVKMMYGNLFLRPHETYHVTTRKFLEQELFKSDQHQAIPLSQLTSKCFVMCIKDYIKYRPEGFADKDVYVCESRYNSRARSFKKIKNWPFVRSNDPVKLIQRDTPIELKRIMSVFKERVEKHKGELAELQLQEALVEKEKPNVVIFSNVPDEGNVHYEQYNTICSGVVKIGDYVYVATEGGKQAIAQITSIWETKDGKSFFRGPWLLTPPEVPCAGNRLFYRQEVMLSTLQESSPLIAIVGRCSVLDYVEYTTCRPTEISESDVYICESIYDEIKKQIRRLQGTGLRKFSHSQMVTPDEIYHFKSPVTPLRVSASEIAALQEQLKQSTHASEVDVKTEGGDLLGMMDDSMDGGPPSVGSDFVATASPASSMHLSTPISTKKGKSGKKVVTGYILYSSEVRKSISANNPDATFGDISRIVGNEWRSLPSSEKQAWEEKAAKCNEEHAAKMSEESGCPSPAPTIAHDPVPNQVFECCWDKCDWQFEDPADCLEHSIADGTGHVQTYCASLPSNEVEYNCLWRGCIRLKKQAPPFPHLQRLVKHVREVHINKAGGRIVQPTDRSKNFVTMKSSGNANISVQIPVQNIQNMTSLETSPIDNQVITAPPVEPLFVTVPPRPQRVLHSEVYIKYIEGLQNDSRFISPWEKTLKATQESVPAVDVSRLPTHWLDSRGKEQPEEIVKAIWNLRNYMMKDIVQIKKNYLE
ncbi:protein polybromo-1 isoform X1 [Phlebotomus papatasi]|uniref:protein polybromo-1 isoform X1 n=1 Tax=Phlebotomus papatasi TaxID=29031 RepID=UPI002483C14A|nr:protein polybromo-1 isoform X1 [Phlebotomus papatasi]